MAEDNQTAIQEAEIELRVVLGTAILRVSDVLKLGRGAVVELNRSISAPSDILAAGILVARGQVTIVEDRLAIQISEFVRSTGQRR
ncbi:MAG: FliM/FliN family flagellar motor switch protein [Rhodospirillaceae bacterium]